MRDTVGATQAIGAKLFRLRLPFLKELRAYSLVRLRTDLVAGATLTLVSIPQAIGFALILGLPPQAVIVSVIIGGFVGALFFTSHHHVFGPTSSISLITATMIAAHAGPDLPPIQLAVLLALMIGCIQFLAGLLNFGELTRFISLAVVVAYSAGIGLLLVASQLLNVLGLHAPQGGSFAGNLWTAAQGIAGGRVSWWSLSAGALTWLVFEGIHRLKPRWPEALFGLVVMGLIAKIMMLLMPGAPLKLVSGEGALAASLPVFAGLHLTAPEISVIPSLLGIAVAISILGMLEAASITKSLAAKSGQQIEPRQELAGMGAANIACALFSGVPGSSSFARSAVNFQSGASSQLSSMFSSLVVLAVVLFITPAFGFIPVAALGAHLIRVGLKMINVPQIRIAFRSTRSDAIVFAVTLAACLFLKLDTAIYVGIGISLALFLRKASAPSLVEYSFDDHGALTELEDASQRRNPAISIVHVEGELFFGAADLFQEQVRLLAGDPAVRVVILRMKNARHLDATSVMSLLQLHDYLRKTARHLLVSGINPDVQRVLADSGALAEIGPENIFPAEANLTASTRKALLRATHLLQTRTPDVRIFYDRKRAEDPAANRPAPPPREDPTRDFQI
ncbi:MAG: SulP family inorganic anion transporter [Opitutaceae bacterium]|jgi:SulP family sulfate permease|nr:SulP family inorganic anion transporter [Opitutaceae bacterium]